MPFSGAPRNLEEQVLERECVCVFRHHENGLGMPFCLAVACVAVERAADDRAVSRDTLSSRVFGTQVPLCLSLLQHVRTEDAC